MLRFLGAEGTDVAERFAQDFAITKQEGGQGLVPGAGGDTLLKRRIGRERFGLALRRPNRRQAQAEIIVAAGPVAVSLLGAASEVAQADRPI